MELHGRDDAGDDVDHKSITSVEKHETLLKHENVPDTNDQQKDVQPIRYVGISDLTSRPRVSLMR